MNTIQEIVEKLKTVKSAIIFTHTRPDGDAIGSGVALSRALFALNIPNEVVNDCAVPDKFSFLEGVNAIKKMPTLDAEAYICVDSSDENRLGTLANVYLAGARKKLTFNLDHHVSNTRFAKFNLVRERSSNCENILDIILAMGVTLDKQMAKSLLLGMVTDSGSFMHNDVDGDTLRRAAAVVDAGASVDEINYQIFRNKSKAEADLHADAFAHIRYLLDGKLAISVVSQEMLARHGATPDYTEGIVDFALAINTTEVSVALLEMKKGQYKASFRSRGKVNVNKVAAVYGGGGHVLASGCMFFGELEEIVDKLRYTVYQHLEE